MRYNRFEVKQLISAVNCDSDWLSLLYFVMKYPEFFNDRDRKYLTRWLEQTEHLFL